MAASPKPVELEVLYKRLGRTYNAVIAGVGQSERARLFNFRSRALLAFALECLAGTTAEEGAAAIVDGGGDNGIDAIHVGLDRRLWLLQSKYIDAAVGEPDLGDVNKVCTGVRDRLGGRWERFNDAVRGKRTAVAAALDDPACQVEVVLVHTGGAMSDDRRHLLGDLERAFNAGQPHGDYLRTSMLGLEALHDPALGAACARAYRRSGRAARLRVSERALSRRLRSGVGSTVGRKR